MIEVRADAKAHANDFAWPRPAAFEVGIGTPAEPAIGVEGCFSMADEVDALIGHC